MNRGPIDLQRPTVQPSRHEASTQNRFQPYAPARPTATNPAGTGNFLSKFLWKDLNVF